MVNKMETNKDIELRSREVEDIMGTTPKKILQWGSSILFIVVITLLIASYWLSWPQKVVGDTLVRNQQTNQTMVATITPDAVEKIKIGQSSYIRFDNFPEHKYGFLNAQVVEIKPKINEDNRFEVLLQLQDGFKTSKGYSIPLNKDLIGKAEIITGEKRIIELLFP